MKLTEELVEVACATKYPSWRKKTDEAKEDLRKRMRPILEAVFKLIPEPLENLEEVCPKCGSQGKNFTDCEGVCPFPGSPRFKGDA